MTQRKALHSIKSENNMMDLNNKDYEDLHGKGNVSSGKVQIMIVVCAIFITAVCVFFSVQYWGKTVSASANAIAEAYEGTKDSTVAEKRQELWNKGYAKGEAENHTRNRGTISIVEVRETANLEVMKVSDIVYITGDDEGAPPWLKATGTGVYTVNLAAGEYLIDDERQYVLVRVPRPELATVNIDDAEQLLIKDNKIFFNGNISEGEDRARSQRAEAQIKLLEDIEANQTFYQNAEKSAKTLIESLVRKFNSKVEDLKVDVEFFD